MKPLPSPPHPAAEPRIEPTLPEELLAAGVEAILLTVDKPLAAPQIAQALGLNTDKPGKARIAAAVAELNQAYQETGRSFQIHEIAGGYRIMTNPEFAGAIAAILGLRSSSKLSPAALETLAIVAYKQPLSRAHVESIRGVSCGDILKNLLERRLLAIAGRADEIGRPILYGTSKHFLEVFALGALSDLPPVSDLPAPPPPQAAEQPNSSQNE